MNPDIKIYNLRELGTPLGPYSQVARVKAGEFLFIAGMVATDAGGNVIGEGDFELDEKHRSATFTDQGIEKLEEKLTADGVLATGSLYDIENVSIVPSFMCSQMFLPSARWTSS